MNAFSLTPKSSRLPLLAGLFCVALAPAAYAQQVTFFPYIQLGDNGPPGASDQMVVAWQTSEATPNASAYTVQIQAGKKAARTVARPAE